MHDHEITLGLSFLLGAFHALEPGHGKTAMMVHLAGEKRSFWHPLVMALSTAVAHCVSLFTIAVAVHLAHHMISGDHHHEHAISGVLQWASAILILVVGFWMLIRARNGQTSHCCSNHTAEDNSEHSCSHTKAHSEDDNLVSDSGKPASKDNFRMTALMGFAVGLLPCPSSLAAYFTALSSGTPATAYVIIALFAAGIVFSLSAVGIVLQLFGDRMKKHLNFSSRIPWQQVRAFLIIALGLFYSVRVFLSQQVV